MCWVIFVQSSFHTLTSRLSFIRFCFACLFTSCNLTVCQFKRTLRDKLFLQSDAFSRFVDDVLGKCGVGSESENIVDDSVLVEDVEQVETVTAKRLCH